MLAVFASQLLWIVFSQFLVAILLLCVAVVLLFVFLVILQLIIISRLICQD